MDVVAARADLVAVRDAVGRRERRFGGRPAGSDDAFEFDRLAALIDAPDCDRSAARDSDGAPEIARRAKQRFRPQRNGDHADQCEQRQNWRGEESHRLQPVEYTA
jgi:hypothetical protein